VLSFDNAGIIVKNNDAPIDIPNEVNYW
jgi:hypothetical protein